MWKDGNIMSINVDIIFSFLFLLLMLGILIGFCGIVIWLIKRNNKKIAKMTAEELTKKMKETEQDNT